MVILASASPRRRELLKYIFDDFAVRPADCDETSASHEPSAKAVEIAVRKARAAANAADESDLVIAADTLVYINGETLGKPGSDTDARRMLTLLSGDTCTVFTGVAVSFKGQLYGFCEQTDVTFYPLSARQIDEYISSGEPMDKAGAFGIQNKGALLVQSIDGDFYNVMGLPVGALWQLLVREGITE